MLEISSTPNPTLNLPYWVNKCKSDIKTYLFMQLCYFHFLIQIWAVLSNRSLKESIPELFISQVQCRIAWATEQTCWIRKRMHMKLYMWWQCSKVYIFKLSRILKLFLTHNLIFCKPSCEISLYKLKLCNCVSGNNLVGSVSTCSVVVLQMSRVRVLAHRPFPIPSCLSLSNFVSCLSTVLSNKRQKWQ